MLRFAAAMSLAWVAMPISAADAHGMPSPGAIAMLLGALAVHIAVPVILPALPCFRGRRARVFGLYAAVMAVYYAVMWIQEVGEMFIYPVFPLLLGGGFYYLMGKVPEQE